MKDFFEKETLSRLKTGGFKRTLLCHLGLALGMGLLLFVLGQLLEAVGLGSSICPAKLFFKVSDRLRALLPESGLWSYFPSDGAPIRSYSCPFCGMTRAHLAALRLDLAGALAYHPLFFLGLPYLFLLFHDSLFSPKGRRIKMVLCVFLTLLLLFVWFFRLFI